MDEELKELDLVIETPEEAVEVEDIIFIDPELVEKVLNETRWEIETDSLN